MKTFKQYITEWSYTDPGINAYLVRRGYIKLGKGVDQTAWLAKDGTVLKIFGADDSGKLDHFSKDHKMFMEWEKYCEQHSNNKFLPKYHGWETFEYSEQKYLQIKTERLEKLTPELGNALQNVLARYSVNKAAGYRNSQKKRITNFDTDVIRDKFDKSDENDKNEAGVAQLMMLLGEKDFSLLYDTIGDIGVLGRKNNWGIDLHKGNFMMRADGTPVITDPFVIN